MQKSAQDTFKDALDKAFSEIKPNLGTMTDHAKYKQGVTEENSEDKGIRELDKNEQGMVYGIADILRKVDDINNRRRMAKDMVNKFKREKIKFDYQKFLKLCELGEEKKKETKEATGSGSSGAFVGPVFGGDDAFWERSRSENPKLEEQRRKTMNTAKKVEKGTNDEGNTFKVGDKAKTYDTKKNITIKGLSKKNGKTMAFYMDGVVGREIDIDGLNPIKEQVEKVEAKEATTSGSVGSYSTPSMWAKSTSKKDWGPSRKTQIPGGGFVKVKKKCSKFPYCNKGDINALTITKNESVKEAIKNVSKRMGVSETVITTILEHEYEKINKRHK
jgi:hypothetical protein